MPYLNWKTAEFAANGAQSITKKVTEVTDRKYLLELVISRPQALELQEALAPIFGQARGELRVDLPDGWIIFWKNRDSESRLLLAHPAETEWVATVALDPALASLLLTNLSSSAQLPLVSHSGQSVSNLELLIKIES